jgi:hypothetical protein
MVKCKFINLITACFILGSCSEFAGKPKEITPVNSVAGKSFQYDVDFIRQYDSEIIILNEDENAQVLVSPKYQAKVLTSSAEGMGGTSFGWINYKAFTAPVDAHMNGFGGENRFWLGPEGGKFSLFFAKGKEMTFANWKTPVPFDIGAWDVTEKSDRAVTMQKNMKLVNYAGTELMLNAKRTIEIFKRSRIAELLGENISDSLNAVGYAALNTITNTGNFAWNETTGMPCIWMLDMFTPSDETVIVVPYKNATDSSTKVATTDYFGEISSDRIRYQSNAVLFRADGKNRGKLGLAPDKAKPFAGSFDPLSGVLTITMFDLNAKGRYLNQEWNTIRPVFSGDAVNAYNDGPLADGSQMGPFYEIESVSPAAFLAPGTSMTHNHFVFHFTGPRSALDKIARKTLGISLAETEAAF